VVLGGDGDGGGVDCGDAGVPGRDVARRMEEAGPCGPPPSPLSSPSGDGVIQESERNGAMTLMDLTILADWFLPREGSNLAHDVNRTWMLVVSVTGFFFCIVVGVMTVFVIRFRRRTPNDPTSKVTHNTTLEILWTAVPLALVLTFFYVGFRGFLNYDTPRSDSLVVSVEARQWQFSFTYPNGAQDGNLYVLKDQPVRLNMHSVDVLHALFIPNFGTQRNIIPGRETSLWFIPTQYTRTQQKVKTDLATGKTELVWEDEGWPIYCTQYCGDGHSRMFARVFVLDQEQYEAKMKELANPFVMKTKEGKKVYVPYVKLGESLYNSLGCGSCHSVKAADKDSNTGTGPPWAGLWKRDHEFSYGNVPGYTLKATDPDEKWEAYLRESILDPDAKLVRFKGRDYHGMSTFAGSLGGSSTNDEKLRSMVDYIKSLGNTGWKPEVTPEANPDLFDAEHPTLVNAQGLGLHPESLAGVEARKKTATQSQPASASRPGN
jgi:cytochrome c oxidase subunit II